ncbi:hypothetical protein SAMN05877809_1016 [Rhodobacter sp. JA431]|nr:hypothetical protein SAMN05877809_1016 [Rhodobacter sp. JA431]
MHNAGRFLERALLAIGMLLAQPLFADTILDQVLDRIAQDPALSLGSAHINYAEAGTEGTAEDGAAPIDGSVQIAVIGAAADKMIVTLGDTTLVEELPLAVQPDPLNIATSSIGASNTGHIELSRTVSILGEPGAVVSEIPSFGATALNGAMTTTPVSGAVILLGPADRLPFESISTSAIGSSNLGGISISISNITEAD